MTAAALAIQGASLKLGAFGLRGVDLELAPGEIMVLIGPNGAGKSVCLEMIAGFHRPTHGRILINGRDVTDLAPERRHVGLLFQNFGLFPHFTVAGNVALGLRARRDGAREARSVDDLLAQLGVAHLADRRPGDLSPGEKQRVALARALAARPDLFLFDEPFSALDGRTRETLRDELRAFLRQSRIAAIFVSHDHIDAMLLADRVAVMHRGEILQIGAAAEVLRRPANAFVADFTGVENRVAGRLTERSGALARAEVGAAVLHARSDMPIGAEALLCVRAEDVELRANGAAAPLGFSGAANRLAGRVSDVANLGTMARVTVECGFRLVAVLTHRQLRELALAPGREVVAEIEVDAIHVIERGAADGAVIADPRRGAVATPADAQPQAETGTLARRRP